MQNIDRRGIRQFHLFLSISVLIATMLLIAGCSVEENGPPSPTPTLEGLTVPSANDQQIAGKGSTKTTTTAIPAAPATVIFPPTPTVPDATKQVNAEETILSAEATETVERTQVPDPIQTNVATVEPQAALISTAWGPSPGIVQVPIALDKDSMFVLDSVDPDGRFVVGAIVSRALGSTMPARLVMVSVQDGHITEIARYVGPEGSIIFDGSNPRPPLYGADTDGDKVVWNDQTGMRAYTISTGAILNLPVPTDKKNATPTPTHLPYVPSFLAPRVDHGIAVWHQYAYVVPNSLVAPARIMEADLATGDVTVLSTYGTEAAISWPYVGWVEYSRNANEMTLIHHGTITLFNLQTRVKTSIDSIVDAATFGLNKNTIIYSRSRGQAFISDLSGASSRLISGASFTPYQSISLNDRIVTWMASPPQVAYDRAQDKRVYLAADVPTDAMQLVRGHMLAWQTTGTYIDLDGASLGTILSNDQSVYVLDTDKLPK